MFLLDSLMISGIRWVLETVVTATDAEMNDDTALREQLLEAEMRREAGEISDDEFVDLETDLLARIREIRETREGSGPLTLGAGEPIESSTDNRFQVEASVAGDFYGDGSGRPPAAEAIAAAAGAVATRKRTPRTTRTRAKSRT